MGADHASQRCMHAIPMDNHHCSCELTHGHLQRPGLDDRRPATEERRDRRRHLRRNAA